MLAKGRQHLVSGHTMASLFYDLERYVKIGDPLNFLSLGKCRGFLLIASAYCLRRFHFPGAGSSQLVVRLYNQVVETFDTARTGRLDQQIDEGDKLRCPYRGARSPKIPSYSAGQRWWRPQIDLPSRCLLFSEHPSPGIMHARDASSTNRASGSPPWETYPPPVPPEA